MRRLAIAAVPVVAVACSSGSSEPEERTKEVPAEVVELVESLVDDREAALAEEAVVLVEPDVDEESDKDGDADDQEGVEEGGQGDGIGQMLPEGATIEVRPGSWSREGATASVVADVSVPGFDPVPFLVVLATDEPVGRDDDSDEPDVDPSTWRISGTFPWEEL